MLGLHRATNADDFSSFYAQRTRDLLSKPSRDAWLSRVIGVGDCVWGLIPGHCMWLPAVVDAANEDGSYDLSFPLTAAALSEAQALTASRQLLAFQQPTKTTTEAHCPRPFRSEREVCGYVFDLIAEKATEIDGSKLFYLLKSELFRTLVSTSQALEIVVFGGQVMGLPKADDLLVAFIQECNYGKDLVGKASFIEFSLSVLEMYQINRRLKR